MGDRYEATCYKGFVNDFVQCGGVREVEVVRRAATVEFN